MVGKMSKIDSYQHRGSELRNTALIINEEGNQMGPNQSDDR